MNKCYPASASREKLKQANPTYHIGTITVTTIIETTLMHCVRCLHQYISMDRLSEAKRSPAVTSRVILACVTPPRRITVQTAAVRRRTYSTTLVCTRNLRCSCCFPLSSLARIAVKSPTGTRGQLVALYAYGKQTVCVHECFVTSKTQRP